MDVGAALIADGQATETVEPGQGTLNDPAMPAESFTRLDAASGNAGNNAALAAGNAAARIVVALVGMQLERTATRPPTPMVRRG